MAEICATVSSSEGKETTTEVNICSCDSDMTIAELQYVFTKATESRITEIINSFNEYYKFFKINTCLRRAHFWAQIREEAGASLTATKEDLNYSADVLKSGYPFSYFKEHSDEAEKYGRVEGEEGHKADEEAIANRVYANRNGNGNIESGDGWKYRGGGLIQITGKTNYTNVNDTIKKVCPAFTTEITKDNVTNVDESVISAMAFWYSHNLNSEADKGTDDNTIDSITKVINPGTKSQSARRSYFKTLQTKWNLSACKNLKSKGDKK